MQTFLTIAYIVTFLASGLATCVAAYLLANRWAERRSHGKLQRRLARSLEKMA